MTNIDYMSTVDWAKTLQAESWNTGHYYVKYRLPADMKEQEIREYIGDWNLTNIWTLFKSYKISGDLMRQIQSNLNQQDLRQLEHEIMLDCYVVRQCFGEQLENYLTYMRECRIYYEEALKEMQNKSKLLHRLERMYSSWSCSIEENNKVASFVDYDGYVVDQVVY